MPRLELDEVLLNAAITGTLGGLEMTGITPTPVGATRFFSATRPIAVIVGLVGKANGSVTINLSERGMLYLAGGLLGEVPDAPDEMVFDGVMEIGNIIAGGIKAALAGTDYQIENISVPSLVLGASYDVYYTRGISMVSVQFELEQIPIEHHKDRFFSTTISLLQLT
ncbi:MAG: chemotaxis protein CheX [Acidobacteriota bacterium]|nr:chemotaxis protein CheX [Acidobacteriota bacterium]